MLKIKSDINQQDLKKVDLHFVKLNDLAAKGLAASDPVTPTALNILYKPWRPNSFFQFEIIINVLVVSCL